MKIQLTKSKYAIVDADDYDFLMQWRWCIGEDGYAVRGALKSDKLEKRKNILMHRVINNTPNGMETDHINGDRLDNRRENLRSVSRSENQRNKVKRPSFDKSRGKWVASLRYYGGRWYKRFDNYNDALETLRVKALELQGISIR